MRKHINKLAFLIIALAVVPAAFADVKIKSKQTASGQSFENTTYIKGKRSRTETMNGAMINITQCDLRRGVQINPAARTYMINEFVTAVQSGTAAAQPVKNDGVVSAVGKVTTTITTKDTGERKQMFGFTARHLIITMETASSPDSCSPNNSKMQMDGWYIDAEFVLDCDQNYQSYNNSYGKKSGCQDKYEMKTVGTAKRGYPVYEKMTMFDQSGNETYSMVNEVVELSKATLDSGLFDVPSDYRQVGDASQMYASQSGVMSKESGVAKPISGMRLPTPDSKPATLDSKEVGDKKEGTVRIGLAGVKTGAVGDGIAAADLAAAVKNTLIEYLKVPNVEVVTLEVKVPSAIDAESKQKECDYVIYANVSHKKGGGGGFGGMFGQALGSAIGRVGIGATGSTVGNIAGQVATQAVVTATSLSANIKSKDEITLDLKLQQASGTAVLAKQFKAKAKSNGDDIITQVVEQAAQAIVMAVGK